jgi:hypothetical protein
MVRHERGKEARGPAAVAHMSDREEKHGTQRAGRHVAYRTLSPSVPIFTCRMQASRPSSSVHVIG